MLTDFLTVAVTVVLANSVEQLFFSRPGRKGLVIASAVGGVTFVGTREGNFSATMFARIPAGNTLVLPLRDFGPLITGEIWVSNSVGNALINGSEIFDVARGIR